MGILNDTGSSVQTVFDTDLASLGYNSQTYQGHTGQADIETANGTVMRQLILIEVQLIKHDGTPASGWFEVDAFWAR